MNAFEPLPNDGRRRFGDTELGATMWGGTLYGLRPGEESVYHWQVGEEEWLLVVAGNSDAPHTGGRESARAMGCRRVPARGGRRAPDPQRHRRAGPRRVLLLDFGPRGRRLSRRPEDRRDRRLEPAGRQGASRLGRRVMRTTINLRNAVGGKEQDRDGIRFLDRPVGAELGAEVLGCSLYDVLPGQQL